jgi:hypothetical protein
MLWEIRNRPHVFIRVGLEVADNPGTLFTDGNAASDATQFFADRHDIYKVPWGILHRNRWTGSYVLDGRRKRCAEVLIPDKIEMRFILDVVCSPTQEIEFPLGSRHLRVDKPDFLEP